VPNIAFCPYKKLAVFLLLLPLSPAFLLLSRLLALAARCWTTRRQASKCQVPRVEKSGFATLKQRGYVSTKQNPADRPGRRPFLNNESKTRRQASKIVQLPRLEKSSFATLKQRGSKGRNGPPGNGL